jgi:coproporphyrinogen III oxidase-like Fe-S oxidoreductase
MPAAADRAALHARFEGRVRLRDPSQLAYLRGPERVYDEAELAGLWRRAAARGDDEKLANHFYLHVPFCKSLCTFCNYERLRPDSPAVLEAWRARVLRSVEVLGPACAGLTFHSLYVGGGTPSTLPARTMDEVFTALQQAFTWHPLAGRSIELDPAIVTADKVAAMRRAGFDHYSFGVQSLSRAVSEAHNRGPQSFDTVDRCLRLLPPLGEASVALDLLMGLEGATPEGTLADLDALMGHPRRPNIDGFLLVATQSYVQQHFGGDAAKAEAHRRRFELEALPQVAALAQAHRYDLRGGNSHHCFTLSPKTGLREAVQARRRRGVRVDDPAAQGLARLLGRLARRLRGDGAPRSGPPSVAGRIAYTQLVSEQRGPMNLLGLGPSARSQIFGEVAVQCGEDLEGQTVYRGHPTPVATELRAFVVHEVRDRGEVDDALLQHIFGQGLEAAAPDALAAWRASGFVTGGGPVWRFDRGDPVAAARQLLWLIPEDALRHAIDRTYPPGHRP